MGTPAEADGPSTSYGTGPRSLAQRRRHGGVQVVVHSAQTAHGTGADKVGIVIVDHGSRKKDSNDMLVEFGRLYEQLTGEEVVEIAHMEIARPTIEEAVGRCAERGARTVVVAPYFLSRGRHIQQDIPALVREAQEKHPGVACIIADPIGIDSLMVKLISNRVAAALEGATCGHTAAAAPAATAAGASAAAAAVAAQERG